ncbi:MAG: electron transport complex subunit RsxC [Gammaproteobacteria bacterium]|nr:electron transport complex subunit RsxC [Gammaproteobacteria bacterium]
MDVPLREAPYRFTGGIEVNANKDESTADRIRHTPIPGQIILPLRQHSGNAATPLVSIGEQVLKGQLLAAAHGSVSANIHAPTSGMIVAISDYPVPHPSNLSDTCIRLIPDGMDMWIERPVTERDYKNLDNQTIIEIIRKHGIVGLGGAVFPTEIKLKNSQDNRISANQKNLPDLHTVVINGAECEPYISCDDKLMQEYADDLLEGIGIVLQITGAERCMFAIENNKPEALRFVKQALREYNDARIELYSLPSLYPQGGEKQLIQSLTGKEISPNGLPLDLGYLMLNVGTIKAIRDAVIDDMPLISRVVTVTGDGIKFPQNVMAMLGTPVSELIEFCGGYKDKQQLHQLIMGGSLMGISLHSDAVPVVKAMNCVLVSTRKNTQPKQALACIRCGECAQVCPAGLLPQQLYWYSQAKNYHEAQRFNLADCIECGACDYVCPSHIPLVQYFRHAKSEIRQRDEQIRLAEQAKMRFEKREQRLEKIATQRAERLAAKKARTQKLASKDSSAIDEIMQRVKQRKSSNTDRNNSGDAN